MAAIKIASGDKVYYRDPAFTCVKRGTIIRTQTSYYGDKEMTVSIRSSTGDVSYGVPKFCIMGHVLDLTE